MGVSMLRNVLLVGVSLGAYHGLIAQNMGINVNGSAPHPSALLDIDAAGLAANAKRGLLIPRVTTAEMNAIATPAASLLVFNTTVGRFHYWSGTAWVPIMADGDGWRTNGNAGTVAGTHFLGTTDNVPFEVRVNNERSGWLTTTGNTAWGHRALRVATGSMNTAAGYQALQANTAGGYASAFGAQALFSNTTGNHNTAVGFQALYANTIGNYNSAFGLEALRNNTTGSGNTATGFLTLHSNTTGALNTAMGYEAMRSNTTGGGNTAVGNSAMYTNSVGWGNAALGENALYSNTDGSQNTAVGAWTLRSNTTGIRNTGSGVGALEANTTGGHNTADGYYALYHLTTGSSNTAVGAEAFRNITSGNNNTAVGMGAAMVPAAGGLTNTTALGYQATVTASNQVRIGNPGVTSIGGQVGWTTLSDARYKVEVDDAVSGLAFIQLLKPHTYRYDLQGLRRHHGTPDDSGEPVLSMRYTGFLAQEVEAAARQVGFAFSGVDAPRNEHDLYGLRYAEFVVPLVKAVQELDAENRALREELRVLSERMDVLVRERNVGPF
jgi:hypothetical protein